MTPQAKTIADEMTEKRLTQVQQMVEDGDYSSCSLTHRQEVDSYLVDGIGLLVLREPETTNAPEQPSEAITFKVAGIPFSVDGKDPAKLLVGLMVLYMFLHHIGAIPNNWKIDLAPRAEVTEVASE